MNDIYNSFQYIGSTGNYPIYDYINDTNNNLKVYVNNTSNIISNRITDNSNVITNKINDNSNVIIMYNGRPYTYNQYTVVNDDYNNITNISICETKNVLGVIIRSDIKVNSNKQILPLNP